MKEHAGEWWSDMQAPQKPTMGMSNETLEEALERLRQFGEDAKAFRGRVELFAASQPQTIQCVKHPHVVLTLDLDQSSRLSLRESERVGEEAFKIVYRSCHECDRDALMANRSQWLTSAGVPSILLHGSFATWRIESEEDRTNLDGAKDFVQKGRGLLIMTGNVGDGKSLLAVAVLRELGGGKFITQNDLLQDLRRGYRDPRAEDVVKACRNARCLVIDDFGVSVGGADELPMLQSIADYRHGEKMPWIITTNLTLDALRESMGARLADRMNQSTFRVLRFTGKSSRAAERTNYFAD